MKRFIPIKALTLFLLLLFQSLGYAAHDCEGRYILTNGPRNICETDIEVALKKVQHGEEALIIVSETTKDKELLSFDEVLEKSTLASGLNILKRGDFASDGTIWVNGGVYRLSLLANSEREEYLNRTTRTVCRKDKLTIKITDEFHYSFFNPAEKSKCEYERI